MGDNIKWIVLAVTLAVFVPVVVVVVWFFAVWNIAGKDITKDIHKVKKEHKKESSVSCMAGCSKYDNNNGLDCPRLCKDKDKDNGGNNCSATCLKDSDCDNTYGFIGFNDAMAICEPGQCLCKKNGCTFNKIPKSGEDLRCKI